MYKKMYLHVFFFTHIVFLSLLVSASVTINSVETEVSSTQDITKSYVSLEKIKTMCAQIYHKALDDDFEPELIVGLSRGGLIPLGLLAGEPMFNNRNTKIINVQSYSDEGQQSVIRLLFPVHAEDLQKFKTILIIDDIADSGNSLEYVSLLFKDGCKGAVIKTATLFYKKRSKITPDYYVEETDDWIVFPWEA